MRQQPPAVLRAGGRALADLVLPRTCAGCALPGAVLCRRCRTLLTRPRLAQPRRHPPGFPPTVAAGAYAGPVQPAVIAFKEHGRAELAGPLGTALGLAVAAVLLGVPDGGGGPVLLVPVPSAAAAVRRRGRDHVRELADVAAAELRAAGVPAHPAPLVSRAGSRRVRDSAGLDAVQRRANLAGRYRARPAPGARVVLVDDVVTSGATLTEAARALRAAGHQRVLAAVVAATPRQPRRSAPGALRGGFTVREQEVDLR
ncbi:ComF family protein [Modestobacter italicus]|uniref:ComF family protein n=1 Tax=Modestobacter italicus (strain DSM 44449 / CECT 9708 / BC 501) TaxID=2732864 RepID=UPI001E6552B7|nr:phosphoribosyltransferase family protein [Modestobacter marinus]